MPTVAAFRRNRLLGFGAVLGTVFCLAQRLLPSQDIPGAPTPAPVVILPRSGFDGDLRGWGRVGEAAFAVDPAKAHAGSASARLTVAPDALPAYQQIRREFTEDILPMDEFRATVWASTTNVADPAKAYLALECLGAAGQRVGIFHSETRVSPDPAGWRHLVASGRAPAGTRAIRLCLVLHAHGTAWFADPEIVRLRRAPQWPDLGGVTRELRVRPGDVLQPRFGGVGFHAYHHLFPASQAELDNVIYKRWRELNPSFVRINHEWGWSTNKLDEVAAHLRRMQQTGTEIYLTTWSPRDTRNDAERADYARLIGDHLEYLIRAQGLTNIHYYCVANELTLNGWGRFAQDLTKFKAYHQAFYDEFRARRLNVGLLATDASPESWWWTIQWAATNMDRITAVYGGHHYVSEYEPADDTFYPWIRERLDWVTGLARAKGKNFILGEFGAKQDGRTVEGVKLDVCAYWDTPQEPLVALQLADVTLAALNSGVYALGYWTFSDFPDYFYGRHYQNKWGTFKWTGTNHDTRAIYYGYGLLTKFFRGPATVVRTESSDPRVRVGAVQHHGKGTWSIAVLNRNLRSVPVRLVFDGSAPTDALRKFEYDPARVPQHPFGDLQGPAGSVTLQSGRLEDVLRANSLSVYTTVGDTVPPAPVRGLQVEPGTNGATRLQWQANAEPDLCYYRVYRSAGADFAPGLGTQIGSTIATNFVDEAGSVPRPQYYKVVAVDQSGNPGGPAGPEH